MENIINALKKLEIAHYTIREVKESSAELFFIKKQLDMRRMKDVTKDYVTVYRDFEAGEMKMRGSSLALISPGMTDAEIEEAVAAAYEAALSAGNPYYELYAGETEEIREEASGFSGKSLSEIAACFSDAIFAADTRTDAFLNSAELFVTETEVRFCSSEGFSNGYRKCGVKGEYVVQCKEPQDVEQFFQFEYKDMDTAALTEKVKGSLSAVYDRARAAKSPKAGTYDIVLSGTNVAELLLFYLFRSNAGPIFAGYFDSKPGSALQGEEIKGEKLNMTLVPAAPFSDEGVPMKELPLLKDGVLQNIHGSVRFCRYMKIEPTGDFRAGKVDNGTVPFEEMKKGCLYPVSFSDFQMNPITGQFGGEMRLAYYYGEDGVEILTGGSINGSLLEKQGDLTFSLERYTDASYSGPFAVKINGVAVSGE
ncbi:MAG: hypothetical protein IJM76_02180 [Lachnospiraceae bacterium]|nr:hypothetical protein [Lachnospiraceae bacterium]